MKLPPLAAGFAAVAALSALGGRSVRDSVRGGAQTSATPSALRAPCPPGALPDNGVCIPVPVAPRPEQREAPQRIPRRPDRDAAYARYELPVAANVVASVEPGGTALGADGRAPVPGILIRVPPRTAVVAVALEHEEGKARVVYGSPSERGSLVTLHTVQEHGRTKDYLVVFSELVLAPVPAPRAELGPGASLGVTARDTLGVDVRLLRSGTDVWSLAPEALTDDATSLPVDPRNVLRVRSR